MVNQFERVKQAKDLLSVGHDLARYAREGWQQIPKDDVERLKIFGVALRQKTPGFFLMRVRVPAGQLSAEQLISIGRIAARFGRDRLDITTRAQLQLRWVRIEHIPTILDELKEAGLLTVQTLMDSVRNIITCPLVGVCPAEVMDVRPVLDAVERRMINSPEFVDLPRKVNIAISGCGGHGCATKIQDISLVPARSGEARDAAPGFIVLVGGKASGNSVRAAEPLDVFVQPGQAAEVIAHLVRLYRDHGSRDTRGRSRMAYLVEQWGVPRLKDELERAMGRAFPPAGVPIQGDAPRRTVGVLPLRDAERVALGLHVPVGQLTGTDAQALAKLARAYGDGSIRLTERQNLLIMHVPREDVDALARETVIGRYPLAPHPAHSGTQSCTGSAFCALSAINTKARARELADALVQRLPEWRDELRIHWSGCRAGCGRHIVADIGLLGRRVRGESGMIEAVDVYLGGSSADPVAGGTRVREAVPCQQLPAIIEQLVCDGTLAAHRPQ